MPLLTLEVSLPELAKEQKPSGGGSAGKRKLVVTLWFNLAACYVDLVIIII